MGTDDGRKPERVKFPGDGLSRVENSSCVEYLQRTIARLLMKNEVMRFELFAVRQKIREIDRTVFGANSQDLQVRLPSYLMGALRDLCRCAAAGAEPPTPTPTPTQQSSENEWEFRKN